MDEFNSQISFNEGTIRTRGKGIVGGELFQISLNPKEWINEQNSRLRVKLSHLKTATDAYITKYSNDEWKGTISSDNISANVDLLIDEMGKFLVDLRDLNISSLDNIEDLQLSPRIFPTLHLSAKNSIEIGRASCRERV